MDVAIERVTKGRCPALDHGGPLNWIEFSPDGQRLLTTGQTPYLRVWNAEDGARLTELTLGTLPPDIVNDYAKLLAGHELSIAGVMVPLKPRDLANLCRSLRQRAPELFQ